MPEDRYQIKLPRERQKMALDLEIKNLRLVGVMWSYHVITDQCTYSRMNWTSSNDFLIFGSLMYAKTGCLIDFFFVAVFSRPVFIS